MLQSLISLEDDQIDIVLTAVAQWCEERGVLVDSPEGRRAIVAAVDVVANHQTLDFRETLYSRLGTVA